MIDLRASDALLLASMAVNRLRAISPIIWISVVVVILAHNVHAPPGIVDAGAQEAPSHALAPTCSTLHLLHDPSGIDVQCSLSGKASMKSSVQILGTAHASDGSALLRDMYARMVRTKADEPTFIASNLMITNARLSQELVAYLYIWR